MVAVILIGVGATLWLWPEPDIIAQVGPTLATISALPTANSSIPSTAATATKSSGRRAPAAPVIVSERRTANSTSASPIARISVSTSSRHPVPRTVNARTPESTPPILPVTAPSPRNLERTTASSPATTSSSATTSSTADPPGNPVPETTPEPAAAVDTVPGRHPEGGPAIPAAINIPFPSSNHPDGVTMTVMPHGPAANGEVWIPGPEEGIDNWADAVSWLNTEGFAAPYSTHGAVIIAGHINWKGTAGALSDLSEYGADDIGRTLTVTMTDGRVRTYRITEGLAINKAELAAESNQGPLHTTIFGQIERYGSRDHPTEELRLISCGGEYDAAAASYESNVIIFARPIG